MVSGLCKAFAARTVLTEVGFEIPPGQVVAMLGPSGAGKTTLLRCLAGLTRPDAGTILLDGCDLASLRGESDRRARRRIAVVFQEFNLVRRMTALENVLAGRLGYTTRWRGWLRRFDRGDRLLALECLERVGLLDHADQRADTLSGGQQQRVAIARAIAQQPRLILADEPVASVDPVTSAGILELFRTIAHRDGVAVLCSLHQPHLAQLHADRVLGLVGGRIEVDAPADTFDAICAARVYGASEPVCD